jgi:hypothetical protein
MICRCSTRPSHRLQKTEKEWRWNIDPNSLTGKSFIFRAFKERALRAFVSVLCLAYLRLTIAILELLNCNIQNDGSLRLSVETSVECYAGTRLHRESCGVAFHVLSAGIHGYVVILAWIGLLVVTIGFPLGMWWGLYTAHRSRLTFGDDVDVDEELATKEEEIGAPSPRRLNRSVSTTKIFDSGQVSARYGYLLRDVKHQYW